MYDATRYAWPVNRRRVENNVDLILGCNKGVVEGVYVTSSWLDASPGEATRRNFPELVATHKGPRLGFVGREADEATRRNYLRKRVPGHLAIGQAGFRYFDDLTRIQASGDLSNQWFNKGFKRPVPPCVIRFSR